MLFYVGSMADYASLIWAKNHTKYQNIRDEPLYPCVLQIPGDKYRTAPIFSPMRAYGEWKPWLRRSTQRLPVCSPMCSTHDLWLELTFFFASKSLTLDLIRPTFEGSTCISDKRSRMSQQWLKAFFTFAPHNYYWDFKPHADFNLWSKSHQCDIF